MVNIIERSIKKLGIPKDNFIELFSTQRISEKNKTSKIVSKKINIKECAQEDSNLHIHNGYQPLKLARLPIPPCALVCNFI